MDNEPNCDGTSSHQPGTCVACDEAFAEYEGYRIIGGTRYCEDYPCCGHEAGDCDGSKYGTDEEIKQRVYERMASGEDDYPEPWEE